MHQPKPAKKAALHSVHSTNEEIQTECKYHIESDPLFEDKLEMSPQIPIEKGMLKHYIFFKTISNVSQSIKYEIPELSLLRENPDLLQLINNLITNAIPSTLSKEIDKRSVLGEVYLKIYPDADEDEISRILHNYDFLKQNHMIKKNNSLDKLYRYFKKNFAAQF